MMMWFGGLQAESTVRLIDIRIRRKEKEKGHVDRDSWKKKLEDKVR